MLNLSEDLKLRAKFVFNKLFVYNWIRETIDHKNFKCQWNASKSESGKMASVIPEMAISYFRSPSPPTNSVNFQHSGKWLVCL